jgi:hypothetical protein
LLYAAKIELQFLRELNHSFEIIPEYGLVQLAW